MSIRRPWRFPTNTRKHSANIAGRSEARFPFVLALALTLGAALILSACSAGANLDDPAERTQTADTSLATPAPTRLPQEATETAETSQSQYVIERIVLTTELNSDGSPANEVSVLSQEQQNIYLAVRVRNLPEDARFRALWLEDDETIGQSDVRVSAVNGSVQWVALPFRSIAAMKPAATHGVELIINDRPINVYAFRVGVGSVTDVIAEATLALGTGDDGEPIAPGTEFDRFASQIVLITRISNMVDPTGMIFTSRWYRGNVPLAQISPDGGQPRLNGDNPDFNGRMMTFTLVPEGNLIPGEHVVEVLLNGTLVSSYEFTVSTDDVAQPEPEPTEEPEPSPTEVPESVAVRDIVVSREVDEDTSEPVEGIRSIDGYPSQPIELFVSIALQDLEVDDVVEFSTAIGNSIIERYQLPVAALEDGWLATPVVLYAPDLQDRTVVYEIIVYINGQRMETTTFAIESSQEAPAPTPTPNPFDPDPPDDEDDDDD